MYLNKLVRDKVPSLITKDGGSYSLKLLSPLEHQTELTNKLFEEIKEYSEANEKAVAIEELIDIVELAYAAAKLHGYTPEQFERLRQEKHNRKGGFEKGIYLNQFHNSIFQLKIRTIIKNSRATFDFRYRRTLSAGVA